MALSYEVLMVMIKQSPYTVDLKAYDDLFTDEEFHMLEQELFLAKLSHEPPRIRMPFIRQISTEIVSDIVSVQPMYSPTGNSNGV